MEGKCGESAPLTDMRRLLITYDHVSMKSIYCYLTAMGTSTHVRCGLGLA